MEVAREIYIYKSTNLPKKGWIQGCFLCYAPTAYTINHVYPDNTQIVKKINIHVCSLCQDIIKNYTEIYTEYNVSINNYIKQKITPYL